MNDTMKKVLAVGASVGLLGVGVLGGFAMSNPDTIEVPYNVTVVKEVVRNVSVPVEVITEVEVDNGNLDLVLETIYEYDGIVDYLVDDLDDDELNLIVERIAFSNEAKALAVAEVKAEFADLIDKEVAKDGETMDEDDIERVRIQDDDDEVILSDTDFEDSDTDVTVEVKFEQDDVKYVANVLVEIKDGEVEDIDLVGKIKVRV